MAKKQKQQETQIAVAEAVGFSPVVGSAPAGAWGSENISAKDFIIPKILLMQGQSSFVTEGSAMVGQLVDSVSRELLGGKWGRDNDKPLNFIPFYTFRTWVENEKKGDKFEYVRQLPMDAANEDLPLEYKDGDKIMRRDRCINVYVLLPEQLEAKQGILPYVISFRRTSYTAGKKLSTFLGKLADFNLPAAAKNFKLSVLQKENDLGKFCTFDVEMLKDSKPEHMSVAYEWYKRVKNSTVKVDDSDLKTAEKVVSEKVVGDDIEY
jgi:hypothetical protein